MKPDAKRIWLLDMGGEISWCDEPSPDPLHEYDAYLYIHADALSKLVEEWRELRYSDTGSEYENGQYDCADELEKLIHEDK